MNIIAYQAELHNPQIIEWYKQYNMSFNPSILPSTGLIMENICAAFLYQTNSSVCFIESLIANKNIDKHQRDECLNAIVQEIIRMAKEQGYKHIICYSQHEAVMKRSKLHGFTVLPETYYCFGKNLGE